MYFDAGTKFIFLDTNRPKFELDIHILAIPSDGISSSSPGESSLVFSEISLREIRRAKLRWCFNERPFRHFAAASKESPWVDRFYTAGLEAN